MAGIERAASRRQGPGPRGAHVTVGEVDHTLENSQHSDFK